MVGRISGRTWIADFTDDELFGVICGTFGVIILSALLLIVSPSPSSIGEKLFVVLALFLLGPLGVLFVCALPPRLEPIFNKETGQAVLFLNFLLILSGSVSYYVSTLYHLNLPRWLELLVALYTCALLALIVLARYGVLPRLLARAQASIQRGNKVLCVLAPAVFLLATVVPVDWLVNTKPDAVALAIGLLLGVVLCFCSSTDSGRQSRGVSLAWVRYGANALAFAFPFLLLDVNLTYDALHYAAYLGPANAVSDGRVPLVDVFSQYGQSYLLYNVGFLFLPRTFRSAALITTIATSVYITGFVLALRKLVRNDLVFLVSGALSSFFFLMFQHHSMNTTPSHGGLRYLPPMLLALSLLYLRGGRLFSPLSIAALSICCIWSFEAAVFGISIYGVFLLAESGRGPGSVGAAVRLGLQRLLTLGTLLVGTALLIVTGYFLFLGKLPRYDLYVSLVAAYVGPDPFMDYWYLQYGFYAWMPLVVAYFVGICFVARQIAGSPAHKHSWVTPLGTVATFAACVGAYCLISTQPFILRTVFLPFFLLFFWAFDASSDRVGQRALLSVARAAMLLPFVLLVSLMVGIGVENFNKPRTYLSPNTTVLRYFLDHGRLLPRHLGRRLKQFCPSENVQEVGNACSPGSYMPPVNFHEMRSMVERWQGRERELLLFHPQDTILLIYFGRPHVFPFSFSYVDGFSRALFAHILDRSKDIISHKIAGGDTLIVTKHITTLNELEWAVLKEVLMTWQVSKVDETENLNVYRLTRKGDGSEILNVEVPNRPVGDRNTRCLAGIERGNWCQ